MSDTIDNTILAGGVWLDLYSESGISTGTKIIVHNLGTSNVLLNTGVSQPTKTSGFVSLKPGESLENKAGDSGAWAHSVFKNGLVNVGDLV